MTISVSMLRLFVESLEELYADWHALLRGCEIDPEQLADPEDRISQDRFEQHSTRGRPTGVTSESPLP